MHPLPLLQPRDDWLQPTLVEFLALMRHKDTFLETAREYGLYKCDVLYAATLGWPREGRGPGPGPGARDRRARTPGTEGPELPGPSAQGPLPKPLAGRTKGEAT